MYIPNLGMYKFHAHLQEYKLDGSESGILGCDSRLIYDGRLSRDNVVNLMMHYLIMGKGSSIILYRNGKQWGDRVTL